MGKTTTPNKNSTNQHEEKNGYVEPLLTLDWMKKNRGNIYVDDKFKQLIVFYVVNTPGIDLSSRGIDLRTYNWSENVYSEDKLIDYLLRVVNINQSSFAVAKGLNEMESACEEILITDDFYNNRDSEKMVIFQSKPKDNCKNDTRVKSFFYHLRNSFAHGRFEIYNDEEGTTFVMEDVYQGNVSARMILKQSTLIKWMEILQSGKYPEEKFQSQLKSSTRRKVRKEPK